MTVASGVLHRLQPAHVGRAFLLCLAGVWVVVRNNSLIAENAQADPGFAWLRIPREARLVEAGVLVVAFVVLQPLLVRSRIKGVNWLLWIFLAISAATVWMVPTHLPSQFQGIFVHVAPFLVFVIAWAASPTRRLLGWLLALFAVWTAVSIAVALLVQLPAAGAKGDWIYGFFSDAHAFGSFLAVGSCVAFGRFLDTGGVGWLLGAGALLAVSYFPANEKVIVFNVVWCSSVLACRLATHVRGWRGWTAAAVTGAFALSIVALRTSDSDVLIRTDLLRGRSVSELGVVQAWARSWKAVADDPLTWTIGLGSGNFGGVAAARAIRERPENLDHLSPAAREVLVFEAGEGGAVAGLTNTWANMLAEFGVLGLGVFALAVGRLAWPVWQWRSQPGIERLAQTAFLVLLAVVVWQGFFTPYTNWGEPALTYPMMVVAAFCHRSRVSHPEGSAA